MKQSNNQFTKEFEIKTFESSTTDKSICSAAATCIYTIENVVFRPNLISPSAYVLQGNIHVSLTQRCETTTNSRIFLIMIDLLETGAPTMARQIGW
jgi:hypothetical protein